MTTHDIDGVEIFAVGEWNGDPYTPEDLDQLVSAFAETKDHLKPYLKLGHSKGQGLLAADELPSAGWISNLYRQGAKLVADFKQVPKVIHDLIQAGGYKRVSSEIYLNAKVNGKLYPKALKAVAMLGGETPAVSSLKDIMALYALDEAVAAYEKETETRSYEMENTTQEEHDMKTVEELQKDLAKANEQLVELSSKHSEAEKRVAALEKESQDLKARAEKAEKDFTDAQAKLSEVAQEKRKVELTARIEKAVNDKQIMPSQKALLFSLLEGSVKTGEKNFKVGEKEYSSVDDLVFAFIGAGSDPLNTDTKTGAPADNSGDLNERAKAYAEKHKVDFKSALIAVSPSGEQQ